MLVKMIIDAFELIKKIFMLIYIIIAYLILLLVIKNLFLHQNFNYYYVIFEILNKNSLLSSINR